MIVWIDGTFGVGKSTVAEELARLLSLSNIVILDSDEYYLSGLKNFQYMGGGTSPQNNMNFLSDFKIVIETEASKPDTTVIVVMALSMDECREHLFLPLAMKYHDLIHVILTADKNTILSRIHTDCQRDQSWATQHLDRNLVYLKKNYPQAERIDTDKLTPTEVANSIIRLIREHS